MYLVAIAWVYVALMMGIAEATSIDGTVIGGFFTVLLYGVLPLAIVWYIGRTPARRRMQRAREAAAVSATTPDGGDHAAREAVAPERKEP